SAQQPQRALPLERPHLDQLQLEAALRDDLRLQPARAADEEDVVARMAGLDLLGQGDAGEEMASGPSAGDQEAHRGLHPVNVSVPAPVPAPSNVPVSDNSIFRKPGTCT